MTQRAKKEQEGLFFPSCSKPLRTAYMVAFAVFAAESGLVRPTWATPLRMTLSDALGKQLVQAFCCVFGGIWVVKRDMYHFVPFQRYSLPDLLNKINKRVIFKFSMQGCSALASNRLGRQAEPQRRKAAGNRECRFGASLQEECISRILFFVERFWEELLRFSRRTEYQINRWAARYGYKNKPKEILEHAKKGYGGRYT